MEIIVVADEQASKYLSNRENLSTVDNRPVTIGDITESIVSTGPFVWVGGHWVSASPDILIHNQQITNKAEAEALLSCLKDGVGGSVGFRGKGSYDTIIVGCNPDLAEGYLVTALEKYFGYEDITMTFPPLGDAGTPDPRLRNKVNKLLYSATIEEAGVAVSAGGGGVGKIVVVVDKQSSGFLNNPWNFGASGVPDIITRNIVDPIKVAGLKGEGRLFWNGKRWIDVYPRVVIHEKQVTKSYEIQPIIGGLLIGKYETAIIGCDPSVTGFELTRKLREAFGAENVTEIYPHLERGFEQYKDLGDRIKELLDQTGVEGSEGSEGSESSESSESSECSECSEKERTPQKQSLHLKVTLTNTNDPGSTPKTIDVFYNEGTNIELDLRERTQDTA